MNIDQIQTFLTIVKHNSFTKASEILFCSQATVSLRIKKLEATLGVPLFKRHHKSFELTQDGQHFIPYAKKLFNTYLDIQQEFQFSKYMNDTEIQITSSSTPGTYLLPKILFDFHERFSSTKIINQVQYTKDVLRDVESKKYSFGFISQPKTFHSTTLDIEFLMRDPLSLYVSTQHPLAKNKKPTFADLKRETLLVSNPKTSIIPYLGDLIGSPFPTKKIHITGNIEAVKQGLVANRGFSILSQLTVKNELSHNLIKEIPLPNTPVLYREIYVIKHKTHQPSPAEDVLINWIKSSILTRT